MSLREERSFHLLAGTGLLPEKLSQLFPLKNEPEKVTNKLFGEIIVALLKQDLSPKTFILGFGYTWEEMDLLLLLHLSNRRQRG